MIRTYVVDPEKAEKLWAVFPQLQSKKINAASADDVLPMALRLT